MERDRMSSFMEQACSTGTEGAAGSTGAALREQQRLGDELHGELAAVHGAWRRWRWQGTWEEGTPRDPAGDRVRVLCLFWTVVPGGRIGTESLFLFGPPLRCCCVRAPLCTREVCPHPTGDKASQRALYKDMNSVSSQLAGVIENLRSQMAQLDAGAANSRRSRFRCSTGARSRPPELCCVTCRAEGGQRWSEGVPG